MLSLDVDETSLEAEFARLEQEVTGVIRGISIDIFQSAAAFTPQWSGYMASNWRYQIGVPDYSVDTTFAIDTKTEGYDAVPFVRRKGDPEPIKHAMQANSGREIPFKLGDIVYITNNVPHAEAVEIPTINLRAINLPGMPLIRAVSRAETWYASHVNPARVEQLIAKRIFNYNSTEY